VEKEYFAVIVGTGFGGLAAAYQLLQNNYSDIVVLERNDRIGGVWNENIYPGVECDLPSHLYSFSFYPNPNWSRCWAGGAEIRNYMVKFAEEKKIMDKIQFKKTIISAFYDDKTSRWTIETKCGSKYLAKYFVLALGQNSSPKLPNIPGLSTFGGECFHSARWNKDSDLVGKRVGVIGTGASAAQIIASIADHVSELAVFQRSPCWVLPKNNFRYTEDQKKRFLDPNATAEERKKIRGEWDAFWPKLHFSKEHDEVEEKARQMMREKITKPGLQEKLIPNYPLGTKRTVYCDGYLEAFNRDHVHLITAGISRIEDKYVIDNAGKRHELDVIICATGFQATRFYSNIHITGSKGLDLRTHWRDGLDAEAYLGTLVSGFPNMFLYFGPNTGLGHGSIIDMIEAQMKLMNNCILHVEKNGYDAIDIKKDVQDAFNKALHAYMKKIVWSSDKAISWYKTEEGKVTTRWPYAVSDFEKQTSQFEPNKFNLISKPAKKLKAS
jgi:cation diffusion facilitator CzcD-associated flavoprotein CzcO